MIDGRPVWFHKLLMLHLSNYCQFLWLAYDFLKTTRSKTHVWLTFVKKHNRCLIRIMFSNALLWMYTTLALTILSNWTVFADNAQRNACGTMSGRLIDHFIPNHLDPLSSVNIILRENVTWFTHYLFRFTSVHPISPKIVAVQKNWQTIVNHQKNNRIGRNLLKNLIHTIAEFLLLHKLLTIFSETPRDSTISYIQ